MVLDSLLVPSSVRDGLERAVDTYAAHVERAGEYLDTRGITYEAALRFRLGYAADPLPGHERFQGMLSIGYITPAGVVKLKFRRLDEDSTGPKYDGPSSPSRLYNVAALLAKSDTIVICEGELDAIVCTTSVGIPGVGTPGTNFLDHWPRCFADHARVLIVADNDEKEDGSNPGLKHAKSVAKAIPGATIITPPLGLDLNDWVLKEGAECVRETLLGV